jgi:subtilisin family serine protease
MSDRRRFRSRAVLGIAAALLTAVCILRPQLGPAASAGTSGTSGRRPAAHRLSTRLHQLTRNPSAIGVTARADRHRAHLLSLPPRGPGSLLGDGRSLLVDISTVGGTADGVGDQLTSLGGSVVFAAADGTVTALVPMSALNDVAALAGVDLVEEILQPLSGGSIAPAAGGAVTRGKRCPNGVAVSEGDLQLRAKKARKKFGVNGAGVTVGVLSDSFDRDKHAATSAKDDIRTGDLPGAKNPCGFTSPTAVLDDASPFGNEDEGRGMAQIVHDLAPGADLSFATAYTGVNAFANNIRALRAAGADVIVDDVVYFDEPFFQDGTIARAVNDVTADGAVYFSAAGNEHVQFDKRGVGSWMAPAYRPMACPTLKPAITASSCMDFDPTGNADNGFGIKVSPGRRFTMDFQWAEAWHDADMTNFDVYVVDASSGKRLAESTTVQPADAFKPVEIVSYKNPSTTRVKKVRIVVARTAGIGAPAIEWIFIPAYWGMQVEYAKSAGGDVVGPTIFGHAGAENTMSTGAVRYSKPDKPEWFSSRGPVTLYFEPVHGKVPADPLPQPQILDKPDLVATDGGATTFFFSLERGTYRFYGTSAAAPHAAAVAALYLDRHPAATADQVEDVLRSTARPVGHYGPLAVGGGLVDAVAALLQAP